MQQDLFGIANGQQQKKGLIISRQHKETLSKKQKEFNRLVKRIEQLRNELNQTAAMLDEGLKYYSNHIHPLELRLVALRTTGVKIFFSFYKDKKLLPKDDKKTLKEIILTGLEEIFSLSPQEPDDEIKAIFKTLNGQSFDDLKKEQFDLAKGEMEEMFEQMGVDVNFDGFNENMSEEEVARKMKEIHDNLKQQAEENEEKNASRKKTKKQQEREEREKQVEAARKKNIGTIYKQLAKIFHPDLETDDLLKLQKEELMKQLTVAYENNDLHTLLRLEMDWLKKEENNTDQLSDDKLGIYNEALREQVAEAEMEIDKLINHPRYMDLQRFEPDLLEISVKKLAREKEHLKETVMSLEEGEADLKSKDALKYVKMLIQSCKRQVNAFTDEWDSVLEELMKMRR